jgi:hypothetical protein
MTSTLWDLAFRPLSYCSDGTGFGDSSSVTCPGLNALEVAADWRADRCILDHSLLDNLITTCKEFLEPILLASEVISDYDYYIPPSPRSHSVKGEPAVQAHLLSRWLPGAGVIIRHALKNIDTAGSLTFQPRLSGSQIPDFLGMWQDQPAVIVEGKSERVMRHWYEDIMERARQGYEIQWTDQRSTGSQAADLILKVSNSNFVISCVWLMLW